MIKINVEINNKSWLKKIKNPNKYFIKKLKKISKIVKFFNRKNVTFTILLTNSLNMKKLNKKFRNKNKPTDVLSFPFFSQNTSSSLISKLSVDFLNFTRGFVSQTITISSEILIIFSFTIFIIFLDLHKVGFIFLLFFIVGAILMKVIGNLSNSWGKKRKLYDHLKINLLNNTFQNIKSIIIDNKREFVTKNFNSYVKELASLQKKIVAIKVLPRSIFEIFGILSLSVVIMIMTVFDFDKNDILTSTGFFIAVAYRIVPSFQKIIYSYQPILFKTQSGG